MADTRPADADIIVGGQAVLEGVMMRSPNAYAVSVRRPDGTIVSKSGPVSRLSEAYPFLKLPVVRGSATLIQSMALGIKALNFSSAIALAEEEVEETERVEVRAAVAAGPEGAVSVSVPKPRKDPAKGATAAAAGSLVFALVVNVGLFILLPLVATNAIFMLFGASAAEPGASWTATLWSLAHSVRPTFGFNMVEGAIRVCIFLTLIYSMSRLADMRRVFEYHGAEHKVVANYESGLPLTVDNARVQERRHPRCGTSFLMVVMIVAIVLFSVVRFDTLLANAAARVALLPLVAGLSFEVIRAAARKQSGPFFRAMVLPGLWLQGITTQEPSDDQLEVAIHALETSLALEPSAR
jgi:uncharacterized protein YqhQ